MDKLGSFENKTFIDLFAGIGGFRIALERFGAQCVFSSEWDKYAQITYRTNFGEQPSGDITKIDEADIPGHDILCAGFPCQAFSISGKQKGFNDTRGTLFFEIARIAAYHRPKILFLENVRNFAKHDQGKTLETVLTVLNDLGYDCWYKVLNASYYGVPQNRERIYFVCFLKELNIKQFDFPKPTYKPVIIRDIVLPDEQTSAYIIERDDIRINTSKIPQPGLFDEAKYKPIRIGTINKGGQGERIYSDLGHAITLSAHGGGAGAKTGAYLINNRIRKLAPRECARLQGFPDSFQIPVSDAQAYKQFGNSVPIPVLECILQEIDRALYYRNVA